MPLIKFENIKYNNGNTWVLNGINLEIKPAEVLGIYGKTSSGKTTIAQIIAGLILPTSGRTYIDFANNHPHPVSLSFQRPALAAELSVYENLNAFASLHGIASRDRQREISFLLELVELSYCRNLNVSCLSHGQSIRLEIARVLLADSPITIFDGILDNLPSKLTEKLWEYLESMVRVSSKSIIICTTSAKISEMCSRLVVLEGGCIRFSGKPDELRKFAKEDTLILGSLKDIKIKDKISEDLAVEIIEDDGFWTLKVNDPETQAGRLLAEYGSKLGCIYIKKLNLEDALNNISIGKSSERAG